MSADRTSKLGITSQRLAATSAIFVFLIVPLVVAHYVFYATIGLSPSDVGLDFSDIIQRSMPGLFIMVILVAGALLALYSVVVCMNFYFLAFSQQATRRVAWISTAAVWALSLILSAWSSVAPVAGYILIVWVAILPFVGAATIIRTGWRGLLTGVFIAAPLYPIVTLLMTLVIPLLTRSVPQSSPTSLGSVITVLALGIPLLGAGYLVLALPSALAMAESPANSARIFVIMRRVMSVITLKRAVFGFAIIAALGAYTAITTMAYVNARLIKLGQDAIVFDEPALDAAVQHTYGLPVSCVSLQPVENAQPVPDRALLLGSRQGSEYVFLWGPGEIHRLSKASVSVRTVNTRTCY